MKLKRSTSLVSFVYLHLVLIHLLILHIHLSYQYETSDSKDANLYDISEENKKIIIEQVKTNLLKVLGLKEVPKKPTHTAIVPPQMLENYRSYRESVRDVIPDDRDFYGKIPVADLDQDRENFWNGVHNRFGTYNIVVDMDQIDKTLTFDRQMDGSDMRSLISEQVDVDPKIERILPPHSDNFRSQKQFNSVHLKFNLSQEIFTDPIDAEKVRKAELIISRERLDDCESDGCYKKPIYNTNNDTNIHLVNLTDIVNSTALENERDRQSNLLRKTKNFFNKPRYQKVILLHIEDYDTHGDPITRICGSQRIDTRQSTPVVFNIQSVIKHWLKNPTKIFGVIVRVTNDDPEYDEHIKREARSASSDENLNNSTNASLQYKSDSISEGVMEHVRLKRQFHSTSESDETWIRKQPYILISYDQPESERHHVKRDHSAHETDTMQADEPSSTEANASDLTSNNPVQSTTTTEESQSNDSNLSTNKPNTPTSTVLSNRHKSSQNQHVSAGRRDSRQTNSSNQNSRSVSSTSRSTSAAGGGGNGVQSQRSRSKSKPARAEDKCSRRSLTINFDEVGWSSWIIAPQSYNAFYCAGDCSYPLSDHQNATNHAIIQSIFHTVGRVIPRACCAPTKLGEMPLLYQVDGGVQMKYYNDMIVESCGCL